MSTGAEHRVEEVADLVVAAHGCGHSHETADGGENGEYHERAQHDPWALVDGVGVLGFDYQLRVGSGVDGGTVFSQLMRFGAAFAEEGEIPQPEHVERGQARSHPSDEPEYLAAVAAR